MLPKARRMRTASFDALAGKARSVHGRLASLSYIRSDVPTAPSTFAVVVSKAVAKLAVDRNRLRRQAYALIRGRITMIPPGYVCAFFLKKGVKGISYQDLSTELYELLKKADLTA